MLSSAALLRGCLLLLLIVNAAEAGLFNLRDVKVNNARKRSAKKALAAAGSGSAEQLQATIAKLVARVEKLEQNQPKHCEAEDDVGCIRIDFNYGQGAQPASAAISLSPPYHPADAYPPAAALAARNAQERSRAASSRSSAWCCPPNGKSRRRWL